MAEFQLDNFVRRGSELLQKTRETFVKYKGADPVIFNVDGRKILANPALWVNVSNDFLNEINTNWGSVVDVDARSLDEEQVSK